MHDEFQPGDIVTFTNDYGVVWEGKTIVERDTNWTGVDQTPRYYIKPTDAPWFSKSAKNLRLEARPSEQYASHPNYGRF